MQAGNASPPIISSPFSFNAVRPGEDLQGKVEALKDQLTNVKEDINVRSSLKKGMETVKNSRTAFKNSLVAAGSSKGEVYLRHSDSEGIIFSQKRGVLVRLGLSDGGHRKALQELQTMAPGLDVGGAGPRDKIAVKTLQAKLEQDIKNFSDSISEVGKDINKSTATVKKIKAQLADVDKAQASRRAVLKVWGSNVGAEYINGVCREVCGTLRAGAPLVKPTFGKVANFYAESDKGSAENKFPFSVHNDVSDLLALSGAEIAAKVNAALTDRAPTGIYHRGAKLSDKEILSFKMAQQGKRPVRASFFMSVTTDAKTAASFAAGKYGGVGGGREVTFRIDGAPFKCNASYEIEHLFKPGALFNVGRIQDHYPKMTIDLVACKPDARKPVNI